MLDLNLDDVDPGLEDLDDIAGGQLYRLRRGGTGLSNGSRGGHSARRARGGASDRGSHASLGGRGNLAARGRNIENPSSRYVFPADYNATISCSSETDKSPVKRIATTRDLVVNHMLKSMLELLVYNVRLSLAE